MGLVAKAFQDIITFSRATQTGTYVNSSGYITNSSVLNYLTYSNQPENAAWTKSNSFVQQNLLTYSQEFDNAAWSKGALLAFGSGSTANATIAPDGTLTADLIVPTTASTTHYVNQNVTRTTGLYTRSVYVKSAGYTFFAIQVRDLASVFKNAEFNLATGTVVSSSGAVSTSITSVGNGWYRCSFTYDSGTGATSGNDSFFVGTSAGNWSTGYVGDGVSGVYLWGAQEVQGSVPGDYRATTSAALPCLYADYNGALRARKLSVDNVSAQHRSSQIATVTSSASYANVIYVKAGEYSKVGLREGNFTGAYAAFNLATGTVLDQGTGGVGSISFVGNGWYRINMASTSGGATMRCDVVLLDPTYTTGAITSAWTGDGSSGIYIADAQLNDGSSALAYYDTTQYPYNAPRFDYDPVTLAAKGLLVEEQRANLLLQSNDFQTSWSVTNITRTLNSILSPSGNVDGVKIAATATATTALYQQANVAATSATFSVYAKQGTGATTANNFIIRNITTLTNLIAGTLNYSTGVFTYSVGSTGVVVSNAGNGWWRVQISATTGITSGDLIAGYVGFSGGGFTAGDFLYAYGAQLEAGAFATSYIPTVASQVTRAADVASVNTLSPWFNSVGGTIYAEADTFEASVLGVRNAVAINDGTSNNLHRVLSYNGKIGGNTTIAGSAVADLQPLTYTTNTTFKFAYAYAANDFAAVGNGGAPSTDTSGALPTGLTTMGLGNLSGVAWCGHLRRITYYPRRLTNAELQTLTTL